VQKIIFDTNVLVSALIQKNYPYFIVYNCLLEGFVDICISNDLFKEYLDALNRPKFSKYLNFIAQAEYVLAQIESKATIYFPKEKFDIIRVC